MYSAFSSLYVFLKNVATGHTVVFAEEVVVEVVVTAFFVEPLEIALLVEALVVAARLVDDLLEVAALFVEVLVVAALLVEALFVAALFVLDFDLEEEVAARLVEVVVFFLAALTVSDRIADIVKIENRIIE